MHETSGISIARDRIKTSFCWTMEEMGSPSGSREKGHRASAQQISSLILKDPPSLAGLLMEQ
jgi:hypothetical protein